MKRPTHRSEATGNVGLDRIQNNVRDLVARVNILLLALAQTHGVGLRRVQMQDATYTLTSGDLEGAFIVIAGPLTAGRNVVVPRAADGKAYGRWFQNQTGQTLTFVNADGSGVLTSLTGKAFFVVSEDGPVAFK